MITCFSQGLLVNEKGNVQQTMEAFEGTTTDNPLYH